MKAKGIVEFNTNNEKVFLTFNGSKEAFIDFYSVVLKPLTFVNAKIPDDFKLIKAMYFDEALSEEELKIITSK